MCSTYVTAAFLRSIQVWCVVGKKPHPSLPSHLQLTLVYWIWNDTQLSAVAKRHFTPRSRAKEHTLWLHEPSAIWSGYCWTILRKAVTMETGGLDSGPVSATSILTASRQCHVLRDVAGLNMSGPASPLPVTANKNVAHSQSFLTTTPF